MLKLKCSRRSGWEICRQDQKSMSESLKYEGDVDRFCFYRKGIVHYEFLPRGKTVNNDLIFIVPCIVIFYGTTNSVQ